MPRGLMTAANALTSECKCEDNNKQNACCQHQNLGGVIACKGLHGHPPSAPTSQISSLVELMAKLCKAPREDPARKPSGLPYSN